MSQINATHWLVALGSLTAGAGTVHLKITATDFLGQPPFPVALCCLSVLAVCRSFVCAPLHSAGAHSSRTRTIVVAALPSFAPSAVSAALSPGACAVVGRNASAASRADVSGGTGALRVFVARSTDPAIVDPFVGGVIVFRGDGLAQVSLLHTACLSWLAVSQCMRD